MFFAPPTYDAGETAPLLLTAGKLISLSDLLFYEYSTCGLSVWSVEDTERQMTRTVPVPLVLAVMVLHSALHFFRLSTVDWQNFGIGPADYDIHTRLILEFISRGEWPVENVLTNMKTHR
jgi:hypothetical protein